MTAERDKVIILGARGSIPVNGEKYAVYGGATSCVLLKTESDIVLLDAGSGILKLSDSYRRYGKRLHIFLSHYHIDHMMGLMMSPLLFDKDMEVVFYAPGGKEKIFFALQAMMKRPLWPVGPEVFCADIRYASVEETPCRLKESSMTVKAMPVEHPGGAYAYRFDWAGRRIVYATDCELDTEGGLHMQAFAQNADLLIIDAQYTAEEYEEHRGFGHSYVEMSASVIAGSHAKRGLLFHHAPERTDAQIAKLHKKLQQKFPQAGFAREGDVIQL